MAGFASLQTAVVVLAKNAFKNDGRYAHIGAKSMGIMWAAFACLLICWLLIFAGTISNFIRNTLPESKLNKDNILNQLMDQLVMNLHLLELPHQLKMKKTQAVLDSSKSKETKSFR